MRDGSFRTTKGLLGLTSRFCFTSSRYAFWKPEAPPYRRRVVLPSAPSPSSSRSGSSAMSSARAPASGGRAPGAPPPAEAGNPPKADTGLDAPPWPGAPPRPRARARPDECDRPRADAPPRADALPGPDAGDRPRTDAPPRAGALLRPDVGNWPRADASPGVPRTTGAPPRTGGPAESTLGSDGDKPAAATPRSTAPACPTAAELEPPAGGLSTTSSPASSSSSSTIMELITASATRRLLGDAEALASGTLRVDVRSKPKGCEASSVLQPNGGNRPVGNRGVP